MTHLPAEDAEDEIEHKEGPHDDEGDEEDPVESTADSVVGLDHGGKRTNQFDTSFVLGKPEQ